MARALAAPGRRDRAASEAAVLLGQQRLSAAASRGGCAAAKSGAAGAAGSRGAPGARVFLEKH